MEKRRFGLSRLKPDSVKDFFDLPKYYRWLRNFIQRGYKGYADTDVINIDTYLMHVVYEMIEHLRETTHSYPQDFHDESDPTGEKGLEQWKAVLTTILDGLDAKEELLDIGKAPDAAFNPVYNAVVYDAWAKPLQKRVATGTKLLYKYWDSLWD